MRTCSRLQKLIDSMTYRTSSTFNLIDCTSSSLGSVVQKATLFIISLKMNNERCKEAYPPERA